MPSPRDAVVVVVVVAAVVVAAAAVVAAVVVAAVVVVVVDILCYCQHFISYVNQVSGVAKMISAVGLCVAKLFKKQSKLGYDCVLEGIQTETS